MSLEGLGFEWTTNDIGTKEHPNVHLKISEGADASYVIVELVDSDTKEVLLKTKTIARKR